MKCFACGATDWRDACGLCRPCWRRLPVDLQRWLAANWQPWRGRHQSRPYRAARTAAAAHLKETR